MLGPSTISKIHSYDIEACTEGLVSTRNHVHRLSRSLNPMPENDSGTQGPVVLPTAMGQHTYSGFHFKQPAFVNGRVEAVVSRPQICGDRLGMPTLENRMWLKRFVGESSGSLSHHVYVAGVNVVRTCLFCFWQRIHSSAYPRLAR